MLSTETFGFQQLLRPPDMPMRPTMRRKLRNSQRSHRTPTAMVLLTFKVLACLVLQQAMPISRMSW